MPRVRVVVSTPFYLRATLRDNMDPSAAISALETLVDDIVVRPETRTPEPALHIEVSKQSYMTYFDTPSGIPRVPEGLELYFKDIRRMKIKK